jgi:hypothetical protein
MRVGTGSVDSDTEPTVPLLVSLRMRVAAVVLVALRVARVFVVVVVLVGMERRFVFVCVVVVVRMPMRVPGLGGMIIPGVSVAHAAVCMRVRSG